MQFFFNINSDTLRKILTKERFVVIPDHFSHNLLYRFFSLFKQKTNKELVLDEVFKSASDGYVVVAKAPFSTQPAIKLPLASLFSDHKDILTNCAEFSTQNHIVKLCDLGGDG